MTLPDSDAQALQQLRKAVREAVDQKVLKHFSQLGFEQLQTATAEYIRDLVAESKRMSEREGLDGVSATHVERAREQLVVRANSKLYRILGNLGGLLLGVVIPNIFIIMDAPSLSARLVIGTIACGILGTALVATEWSRSQ